MRPALGWIVGVICFVGACGDPGVAPGGVLSAGVWGSDQVLLTVTGTGATIESGCDSGRIEGAINPDGGRFSVPGTYAFGTGGPIQPGSAPPAAHPARYEGTLDDRTMRLTIALPTLSRTLGPYQLTLGRQNLLDRCL